MACRARSSRSSASSPGRAASPRPPCSHQPAVDPAAVTRIVAGLERLELVSREHDARDGRRRPVLLTPAGRALMLDFHQRMHTAEAALAEVIDEASLAALCVSFRPSGRSSTPAPCAHRGKAVSPLHVLRLDRAHGRSHGIGHWPGKEAGMPWQMASTFRRELMARRKRQKRRWIRSLGGQSMTDPSCNVPSSPRSTAACLRRRRRCAPYPRQCSTSAAAQVSSFAGPPNASHLPS